MANLVHEKSLQSVACITDEDFTVISDYLDRIAKQSAPSANIRRFILVAFIEWCNKHLVEITAEDAENYCQYLDTRTRVNGKPLRYAYKNNLRAILHSFFKVYAKHVRRSPSLHALYPGYYNIFEDAMEYRFTKDPAGSLADDKTRKAARKFSVEQVQEVLTIIRNYSLGATRSEARGYFPLSLILAFCGCRVSEAVTIRIQNVDIAGRYFKSGMENGHRKSGEVYFVFPKVVGAFLAEYISDLQARMPENEWLFPGTRDHLAVHAVTGRFWRMDFGYRVTTHAFRRTLESFQLNTTNAVPKQFVEILSNHAPSGTVMRSYNVVEIDERRKMYDLYFPREYNKLIHWLETL